MNHVTLNIGLNNNPYTAEEVKDILLFKVFPSNVMEFRAAVGKYEGGDEPTLIVKISDVNPDTEYWTALVELMCERFTQECIPYKLVNKLENGGIEVTHKELVYDRAFEGERYEFSDEYFIEM